MSDYKKYLKMSIPQLKVVSKNLQPILRLGKSGLKDSVISEIKLHLKKRHLIKIKLLTSFLDIYDKREVGIKIAKMCDAKLIDQIGGTIVIFKK